MNNSCVVRRGGGGSFVIDVSECVGYHVRLRRREPFLIAVVLLQTFENAFSAWKRETHLISMIQSWKETTRVPISLPHFTLHRTPFYFLPLSFSLFPLFVYKRTLHFFFFFPDGVLNTNRRAKVRGRKNKRNIWVVDGSSWWPTHRNS